MKANRTGIGECSLSGVTAIRVFRDRSDIADNLLADWHLGSSRVLAPNFRSAYSGFARD